MAQIKDIKLDGKPNWQAIANEALNLLSADEPRQLSADDRKNLIASMSSRSKVTVTMHTKLDYGQMLDMPLAERNAHKALKKGEEFDRGWFLISYFCTGWAGLKHADTGEELPFTQEAMRHADVHDVAQIIDMASRVAQGTDPNA